MEQSFRIRALKILTLQEYIARAFNQQETAKLYESKREQFQCHYIYVFEVRS